MSTNSWNGLYCFSLVHEKSAQGFPLPWLVTCRSKQWHSTYVIPSWGVHAQKWMLEASINFTGTENDELLTKRKYSIANSGKKCTVRYTVFRQHLGKLHRTRFPMHSRYTMSQSLVRESGRAADTCFYAFRIFCVNKQLPGLLEVDLYSQHYLVSLFNKAHHKREFLHAFILHLHACAASAFV